MCDCRDTNEVLAVHFPHLSREWLEEVEGVLADLEKKNGGDGEMRCRFTRGRPAWIDWATRRIFGEARGPRKRKATQ